MFLYPIDKDVPVPADRKRYPFSEMQPGESVFIPDARTNGAECAAAHNLAAKRRKKGVSCRFAARNVEGGMMVWRIE